MNSVDTNSHAVFVTLGANNHSQSIREQNDYYATEPRALESLLEHEQFSNKIWECACGAGHLSEVLKQHGYDVLSTDLIDRGYGGVADFLQTNYTFDGDILTNPPYKLAQEFAEHALDIVADGHRVIMFLRLLFLEGKKRRKLFEKYPPEKIYVSSSRLHCCKNGDFSAQRIKNSSAQAYAWFIWKKPFDGETVVRWFN